MALYKIPVFEHGSVLTQDMLNRIKEYSIEGKNLEYQGFSNGILQGCQVSVLDHMIQVNPGMLLFEKGLFMISEPIKVPYFADNSWLSVKFKFGNETKERNFMVRELDVIVTPSVKEEENTIEICRFRLQRGAMLRSNYRSLQDMSTEFDTLNVIEAEWAAYGESSVSSLVLEQFAKDAIKKNIQNQDDFYFVEQILSLQGKTMNRSVIELYLSKRLQKPYQKMTNDEIYKGLCEVLKVFQNGSMGSPSRMRENRRIIVD